MVTPVAALCALGGCASNPKPRPDPSFEVQPAEYTRAFTAAKDVLRDEGFSLERVDSARGVITTRPRASSGFMTPWIDHTTTPGDSLGAVLHRERRLVEVRFALDENSDLPEPEKPIIATVEVTVQRLGSPGRNPDATSIRLTSTWTEGRKSAEMREWGPYLTMVERTDPALSARIAGAIRAKAEAPAVE